MQKLIQAKALDVSFIPCTTKKNRPGIIIKIIANPDSVPELVDLLIKETGTLGVRIRDERRICLSREIVEKRVRLEGKEVIVHIKIAKDLQGNKIQEKMEFDDILRIADELGLPARIVEMKLHSLIK